MSAHSDRARELLAKMNIKEKAAQLYSVWVELEENGDFRFRGVHDGFIKGSDSDAKQAVRNGIGQLTRTLGTRPIDARKAVRGLNLVQKFLIEKTRLGIPAISHEECLPGLLAKGGTLFPAAINYGALWDDELMYRIARTIGDELVCVGAKQGLSPVLDVSRDVRWGRTEESLGEDPYLVGTLATAYVRGIQGGKRPAEGKRRALATLKHFVGHSFSEGGRNHAPVRIGERELNDIFLLPFEMAVKLANAGSVMPAYHDIDGEPSSSSRHYITEVLRKRWGFNGIVVSDYEAVSLLRDQHGVAKDEAEATALALRAGMDIELPGFTCFQTGVEKALDRGLIEIGEVDAAVSRVLVEKSRLGLFEHPYVDEGAIELNTPKHRKIAATAAEKSIVLLKNDGILPFTDKGKTAVIGPLADDQLAVFSGYSFPVHLIFAFRLLNDTTRYAKTLREAMTERSRRGEILYSRGCDVLTERPKEVPVYPTDPLAGKGQKKSYISFDESRIAEAVEVASKADRVVVAVGDLAGLFLTGTVGEGSDASTLELPGVQQKLVDALVATGKPLVVVLMNGRPYNLGPAFEKASAVVEAWLPGQEGAEAITKVLYGDVNPGGRLPVSFPKSAGAMPYFYNYKLKSSGNPVQPEFGALYPFGFGLSYTTFEYRDMGVETRTVPIEGEIRVRCTVSNTGARRGDEVVQLYVRDRLASLVRPVKELKGFKRITLQPGESKRVEFILPVDMLNFTISGTKRIVEPGEFEVMIGSSADDIKHSEVVTVTGNVRTLSKRWRMQCEAKVQ